MKPVYVTLALAFCFLLEAKDASNITSMKELKESMGQQKPLVIMFYAPWCGASKEMAGALNQASNLLGSQATVIKIDVENEAFSEVVDLFSIEAIPTIVIRHTGRVQAEDLVSSIKNLVKKPAVQPRKNEPIQKEIPTKKAEVKPLPAPSSSLKKDSAQKPNQKRPTPSKK